MTARELQLNYDRQSNQGYAEAECAHDQRRGIGRDPMADAANEMAHRAARKAAAVGSALTIAPGPLGFATIPVQLAQVWAIQRNLVLDIGELHGVHIQLTAVQIALGLFRIGGVHVLRRGATTALARVLDGRLGAELVRSAAGAISLRMLSTTALRWVPLAGSAAAAFLAYRDTLQIADAAIRLCTEIQERASVGAASGPLIASSTGNV